jgi:hypothetical protein
MHFSEGANLARRGSNDLGPCCGAKCLPQRTLLGVTVVVATTLSFVSVCLPLTTWPPSQQCC